MAVVDVEKVAVDVDVVAVAVAAVMERVALEKAPNMDVALTVADPMDLTVNVLTSAPSVLSDLSIPSAPSIIKSANTKRRSSREFLRRPRRR